MFSRLFSIATLVMCGLTLVSCAQTTTGEGFLHAPAHRIELKTTDDLYRFLTYDEHRFPLVSAHRGGPGIGYPENAIETFAWRAKSQPLIIEFDIQMTKDSVLVLMHDRTLDRTTNGTGPIKDITFAEIKKLHLKDSEGNLTAYRVPTLDEALAWGRGKVIFTLDVKRDVPYAMVADEVVRQKAEPYSIIITYSADEAALVHNLNPDLMISASIRMAGDLMRLNYRNIPDNRLVAFVGTSEVDKGVYDLLHGHGIMCILGTLGNLDRQAEAKGDDVYLDFVDHGADILSTDRPEEVGAMLKEYRKKNGLTSPFVR